METAIALCGLAGILRHLGRFAEALPLARRALSIREVALEKGHADVAVSLNQVALLLKGEGAYEAAEPLLRRALLIYENELGAARPAARGKERRLLSEHAARRKTSTSRTRGTTSRPF